MSEEKKLVPKLRFEKFKDSEAWTSYNLGKEAQILTGGTPSTKIEAYWYPKEIPWMSSGEINKKRVFETNTYISNIGFENSSATWVKAKSILIALAGQGKTRGTVAINEIPLTTNQSIAAIIPFENKLQSEYLFHNLDNRYEEMRLVSSGDGTRGGLNKEIISDLEIIAPNTLEQKKIGDFFKKIDKMIQMQQSKVNKLKDIKSAYLSEMFPKEGEKYPKQRFEGFTEPWKECRLGEVATIRTGYPFNSNDFSKIGKYLVITNGNIQDNLPVVDSSNGNRISLQNTKIVDEYILNSGDILVTMDGTVGRTAKVIEKNQILAQRVGRLTANENEEFLYQSLQTGKFYKSMALIGHGGTIKHISLSDIGSYQLKKPCSQEQTKISDFFKNLDTQISIEEEKLAKLEKLKQGYLNDMFI